jgi:hypothetical protein
MSFASAADNSPAPGHLARAWRAVAVPAARIALVSALLAATIAFTPAGRRADLPRIVTPAVPAAAASVTAAALAAVNQHRPALLAELSDRPGGFEWTRDREHDWKADVLPVPGDAARPPIFLAVFHAFHTCESDGDHVYRLILGGAAGAPVWKLGSEIPETETLGLRVRDHAIDAAVDLPTKTVRLHDVCTIERSAGEPSDADDGRFALLRINDGYRVSGMRLADAAGEEAPHGQAGGVIAFVPPAGARFRVALDYSATLDHRNGDYIHDDEAVIASYWYPHIARLPATLSITATAPAGWTAVAQGEQVQETPHPDGSRTVSWRNDLPTSFFTLDMGRYTVTSRQWRGRLLSAYLLDSRPDTSPKLARRSLDLLQDSLDFYENAFGPFPYRRYAVVETRGPFSGALEAYSFATFGPRTLPEFIPHELSHSWWGGLVPCTYTRSMWNEAFANYSDDLYRRASSAGGRRSDHSGVSLEERLGARKRALHAYDSMPVSRAFDTENEVQNEIGYGKGSQVLRLLEEQIGRAGMIAAMRAFVSRHPRGEAADWPDFERAVAQTSGEDLSWFFDEWLDRAGAPVLGLENVIARPAGQETLVEGAIRQSGTPYRLRLPVTVELRSGAVVRQSIDVRGAVTPFSIRVRGVADRLVIDPDAIVPLAAAPTAGGADSLSYTFP